MRLAFTDTGWRDYRHWQEHDPKGSSRLNMLIEDVRRSPFRGIGKPEPLRDDLAGWWSRRITDEHRLIYRVSGKGVEQTLEIMACRRHYTR